MLIEHFKEEESTLLLLLRKACTPEEQLVHITIPCGADLEWAEKGQFWGKLSPQTLKTFMKQEKIPFFIKFIFVLNIKKYNRYDSAGNIFQ